MIAASAVAILILTPSVNVTVMLIPAPTLVLKEFKLNAQTDLSSGKGLLGTLFILLTLLLLNIPIVMVEAAIGIYL